MKGALALALVLGACTVGDPTTADHQDFGATSNGWWQDLDGGAPVRAVLGAADESLEGPTGLDGWTTAVEDLIGEWNVDLAPLGCPAPFRMAGPHEAAHDLVLIPRAEWTVPQFIGEEFTDSGNALGYIIIKAGADGDYNFDNVPLHELGHAMGNMHANKDFGPSIMTSAAGPEIEPRDITRMACSLGCGPCDPAANPYDLPNGVN